MSTIQISYTDSGFDPPSSPANPGDSVQVTNVTKDDITLTFTSSVTNNPLDGLTSPVTVSGSGGLVEGQVRNAASNHAITFTANDSTCVVDVGPAEYQISATSSSISPTSLQVNAGDGITFYNADPDKDVTLDIESPTNNPFGNIVGMNPHLDPLAQIRGVVEKTAKGTRIKIKVSGSSGTTSTIDVGSGDTEGVVAKKADHCG